MQPQKLIAALSVKGLQTSLVIHAKRLALVLVGEGRLEGVQAELATRWAGLATPQDGLAWKVS